MPTLAPPLCPSPLFPVSVCLYFYHSLKDTSRGRGTLPMAQRSEMKSCIWMCACLLVMLVEADSPSCRMERFTNGSSVYRFTPPPDLTCSIDIIADGMTVVDKDGVTNDSQVHHYDPEKHTLMLRGTHQVVIVYIHCDSHQGSAELRCVVLHSPSDSTTAVTPALSTATMRTEPQENTVNTSNRISVSLVLILLPLIIIFIFS